MSKESTLKKEFTERDVQRMRNLISKNYGDKTRIQAGYEKKHVDYKEGDIWEENGKSWTIKNGIKQSITKFDDIKQLAHLPLCCPECKAPVKSFELNKKMFAIHGKCLDCVVKMETDLKAKGEYVAYEKQMMSANRDSLVDDLDKALDDWLLTKETYVTEQGDIEDWKESTNKEQMVQEAKEFLQKIRELEL